MPPRGPTLVAILLSLLLSGCSGGDDAAGQEADAAADARALTDAPTAWNLRDWWTRDTGDGQTVTFVVTGDQGSDWFVDVTEPEWAFSEVYAEFNVSFDISTVGPIRKQDLAGYQGGRPVEFFQWPLADGATWTTPWDGKQREITATLIEENATFAFDARSNGVTEVSYVYSVEKKWFDRFDYTPNPEFQAFTRLTGNGANFTGDVYRWEHEEVDHAVMSGPGAQAGRYDLPAEATDAWAYIKLSCTQPGSLNVGTGPAQSVATGSEGGQGYMEQCPFSVTWWGSLGSEPRDNWAWGMQSDSADFQGEFHILVRTLEAVPIA